MGYRVDYKPMKKVRGAEKHRVRLPALTGMFFLLFLLLVNMFWDEGTTVMRELLFPERAAVTAAALETLVQELKAGETLKDTVSAFFRTICSGVRAVLH